MTRAGVGSCAYCGRWAHLTWDHAIPRSLFPGELRDDPRILVRACLECNVARTRGFKPPWTNLPEETRAFILEHKGIVFASRYFEDVS